MVKIWPITRINNNFSIKIFNSFFDDSLGLSESIIALTTDNPAIPVSRRLSAFSIVIPPIATTGMSIELTISFNSFFDIDEAPRELGVY